MERATEPPASLAEIARDIQSCRRCGLWRNATQAAAGEGPPRAPIMLVGEQPGDQEDLQGRPFVGPAGGVLDRALAQAGVPREAVFVTNAVKHFKHELRGKRRLHKRPDASEISACRFWLDAERALVRPKLVVAMGASAILGVFGRARPVMAWRGRLLPMDGGGEALITFHPSMVLRIPDHEGRERAFRDFTADLALCRSALR